MNEERPGEGGHHPRSSAPTGRADDGDAWPESPKGGAASRGANSQAARYGGQGHGEVGTFKTRPTRGTASGHSSSSTPVPGITLNPARAMTLSGSRRPTRSCVRPWSVLSCWVVGHFVGICGMNSLVLLDRYCREGCWWGSVLSRRLASQSFVGPLRN